MQAQLRDILLIIAVTLSAVFGGMYYAAKEQSETTINLLVTQNNLLKEQNKTLQAKLDSALVPESSVAEMFHDRIVVPTGKIYESTKEVTKDTYNRVIDWFRS